LANVRDAESELSVPVHLGELSPWVVPVLLAAEDARYYRHPGVDPLAMLRAAAQALRHGRVVSGGSTISQQLAKNLYLSPSRNPLRKLKEAVIAWRLEAALGKRRIMELYLNVV
ncbi:transglycosylase domain-containing protein, partial [Acinetobacter baumannii]|uniref:transglycosylase domain-containing protein n=1 Tax=Acinetobacter baumannii TaxID=470 RepID=UPI00339A9C86